MHQKEKRFYDENLTIIRRTTYNNHEIFDYRCREEYDGIKRLSKTLVNDDFVSKYIFINGYRY